MARTIIVGCDTAKQAEEQRIKLGSLFKIVAINATGDIRLATKGVGWDKSKYVVIATLDEVEGPFPPTE